MSIDVTNLGTLTPIHTNFGSNKDDLLVVEYDVPQTNIKQTLFFKYGQLSIPKWALIPAAILTFGLITALCAVIVNAILSQAVATVTYSQECGKLSKCKEGVGLICGSGGRCVCPSTQYWYENKCDAQPTYGEKCNQTTECRTDLNLVCAEFDNLCNCPNASKVQTCDCLSTSYWTGSICTDRSSYEGSCNVVDTDYQCLYDLYCNGSMCICGPNTQYWNSTANSCFPVDEYLSLCDLTTSYSCDQSAGLYCLTPGQGSQCPFNATSSSTSCDCTNGTYWNGGSCVSKKLINTACFWNCECDSDRGLSCLNMTCLCPSKYYWSTLTNPPACVPQKNYTDTTCFNTSECDTTQGLTCYLSGTSCNCPQPSVIKMCDCLTTQYYDSNLTSCQTLRLYNETCYDSYMCDNTVGLFCQTNVSDAANCSCPEPIRLNMCDCNITSYWDGTACVARLAPNISCTYDYECQAGYVCIVNETDIGHFSDVCRCPLGQYYVNGTGCIPSLNYSEPCVGSYQCYEISPLYCRYNDSNVTCLDIGDLPACDCQDNYYYSSLNRSCLALSNRYETCEEPCQCVQPFTCKQDDFKCDCMYFYSSLNQTCVQYLQYGDNCSSTAQCENTSNAFMICDNGACACNSSGYWNGSQCVFTTNFRMTCTKKSQCYGDLDCRTIDCLGSGKVCVCPNGKYFSTVNTSCVRCNGNDGDYEREVVYLADRDVCAAFRSPRTSPSRTYTSANTDCSGLVPFGSNNVPWLLSLHTGSDLKCLNQVMKSFDDKATCADELYYLGLNSSTALFFDGTPYYSIFTSPTFSGSNCLTICLTNKDNATLSAKPCSGNTGWFDSSRYGAICDYRVPSYI